MQILQKEKIYGFQTQLIHSRGQKFRERIARKERLQAEARILTYMRVFIYILAPRQEREKYSWKANILLKATLTKPDLSFKNQREERKMIIKPLSRQHTHYIFIYFFPFLITQLKSIKCYTIEELYRHSPQEDWQKNQGTNPTSLKYSCSRALLAVTLLVGSKQSIFWNIKWSIISIQSYYRAYNLLLLYAISYIDYSLFGRNQELLISSNVKDRRGPFQHPIRHQIRRYIHLRYLLLLFFPKGLIFKKKIRLGEPDTYSHFLNQKRREQKKGK